MSPTPPREPSRSDGPPDEIPRAHDPPPKASASPTPIELPAGTVIRQALPSDTAAIHALLRPYVAQRLLLSRTEAELIELTRHGFVAEYIKPSAGDAELSDPAPDPVSMNTAAVSMNTAAGTDTAAGGSGIPKCVGFSAVEIYSPKLAELQSLAVHHEFRRTGIGRLLVRACVDRARSLGVMEVLAISSSEDFLKSCGFDYSLPDQKKALFCQLRPRH